MTDRVASAAAILGYGVVMRLRHAVLALIALATAGTPPPAGAGEPPVAVGGRNTLIEGETASFRIPRGTERWLGRFEVPAGAKALHVFAASSVDVDIELRHGAVTAKEAASRGDDDDLVADGESGEEHLMLPDPEAGPWTLIVRHPASRRGFAPVDVAFAVTGAGVRRSSSKVRAWTSARSRPGPCGRSRGGRPPGRSSS